MDLFEKAFKTYPDSIAERGYYEASVLAARLPPNKPLPPGLTSGHGKNIWPRIPLLITRIPKLNIKSISGYPMDTLVAHSYRQQKLFYSTPDKRLYTLFFLHPSAGWSSTGPKLSGILHPVWSSKTQWITDFQSEYMLGKWNRFYTRYADKNHVIPVFSQTDKQYNRITLDDGFYMISAILRKLKTALEHRWQQCFYFRPF